MTSKPQVSVLRSYAEFLAIETEWRELFAEAGEQHSFLRHSWLCASWELAFKRFPNRLRVVIVRRDGRLSVAGCFVLGYRRLRPVARLLGSAFPQLDDVLWRASEFAVTDTVLMLRALARSARLPLWLDLWSLRDDSILARALAESGLSRRLRHVEQSVQLLLGPYAGFDEYFETLSHNLRVDHRRRLRRFSAMPGFAHVAESPATGRETLHWLFSAKREWIARKDWRADWLTSGFIDTFFERLSTWGRDEPEVRIASLRVENRIVAASLSLIEGPRVNFAILTHDPALDQQSPGRTLTLLEIAAAFERPGCKEFDFGHGSVGWKQRLAQQRHDVTSERIRL